MLSFDDKISMYFGGKGDEPMAYIELSLFGGASDAVYDKLTAAICDAVSAETGIAPANIYVKYEEAEHWAGTAQTSDITKSKARIERFSGSCFLFLREIYCPAN